MLTTAAVVSVLAERQRPCLSSRSPYNDPHGQRTGYARNVSLNWCSISMEAVQIVIHNRYLQNKKFVQLTSMVMDTYF